jgi:hypothetical protein
MPELHYLVDGGYRALFGDESLAAKRVIHLLQQDPRVGNFSLLRCETISFRGSFRRPAARMLLTLVCESACR